MIPDISYLYLLQTSYIAYFSQNRGENGESGSIRPDSRRPRSSRPSSRRRTPRNHHRRRWGRSSAGAGSRSRPSRPGGPRTPPLLRPVGGHTDESELGLLHPGPLDGRPLRRERVPAIVGLEDGHQIVQFVRSPLAAVLPAPLDRRSRIRGARLLTVRSCQSGTSEEGALDEAADRSEYAPP